MKKGSRALRCFRCGKMVGWIVPTGKVTHGIPVVDIRMKKDGRMVDRYGSMVYCCVTCAEPIRTRTRTEPVEIELIDQVPGMTVEPVEVPAPVIPEDFDI